MKITRTRAIFVKMSYFAPLALTLNVQEADRFITSEKKNVLVDSFIKWKIIDPAKYYVSVKGDEVQAERRISQTVNDGLRAEFGKRTIHDVVSGERTEIMQILTERADRDLRSLGIQILDVRLRRVDLPKEVSESVYQRMDAERKSVANELRSQGFATVQLLQFASHSINIVECIYPILCARQITCICFASEPVCR